MTKKNTQEEFFKDPTGFMRGPASSNLLQKYGSSAPAQTGGAKTAGGGTTSPATTAATPTAAPTYETDFLKWYRDSYGSDYKGGGLSQGNLSDGAFDVGQTLYKYYLQDQMASGQRDAALKSLASERSAAEQSASITYDKLQKYLPQQLRAQGLGNLGVSDSAMLEAGNQYLATMAKLSGDYNAQERTLEEAYGAGALERELAKADEVKGVLDAYKVKEETEKKEAQDNAFTNLETIISGGYYNHPSELRVYLDEHKGELSDTQYNLLNQMVGYLENSPEEKVKTNYEVVTVPDRIIPADGRLTVRNNENVDGETIVFGKNEGFLHKTDFSKGDNFTVQGGGLTYAIQSGGEETDANVLSAALDVPNDTVFACNQKIYLKRQGKVYIIEARDSSKKGHYDKLYEMFYG